MTRRKVIADSEDEDEGDDVFLPHPEDEFDRPEPEPLSPPREPSSLAPRQSGKQSSDVTDPSFFANIYDTQQDLALQRSHLIENIVRQSQRVSASSGDVSLPSKNNGRRNNPSSGTDLTSPMVLSRPRNQMALFNDDASDFTPRKSLGQVWEIPSSPEDATTPHGAKSSRNEGEAYGKAKRTRSRLASSPVPADMSAAENVGVDHQPEGASGMGSMSTPAAKRIKISHHDDALHDTTKFYIAQSNLTTMQKLEYQKVNVSTSGYGGLPGSLPHQKSSGATATTVAYSTPSGYSPVPPLPWEDPPAQSLSPQRNVAINISSSPDVIGNGYDMPNERSHAGLGSETPRPTKKRESPHGDRSRTPISRRKKRPVEDDVEEDELCRDHTGAYDNPNGPQDSYKPRATKRRAVLAEGFSEAGSKVDAAQGIPNEFIPTQDPFEMPPTLEPPPSPAAAPPKKRGRKKKQQATEDIPAETDTNEKPHLTPDPPPSPEKAPETEPSPEKPKKRRGRPRKSDAPKVADGPLSEPPVEDHELPSTAPPPPEDDTPDDTPTTTVTKQKNSEYKTKRKKSKAATPEPEVEDSDSDSKDDRPPLKQVDSNLRSPSKSISTTAAREGKEKGTTAKSRAGSAEEVKSTPKTKAKETPKAAASQSKPTYRVGLSKRSRIAPLLKSIRK